MSSTLNEHQDTIITEFSSLNDWFDKYEYLITLGQSLEPLDAQLKTEENSVPGCQSQVWITVEQHDEQIQYRADSDSLITRGMLSLLLRVVNNQRPADIVNAEFYFIDKIGLKSHLSPSRAHGLMTIVKHIKSSAQKAASHEK